MFDLRAFDLADLLQCGTALRHAGDGASTMEEAAQAVVVYLREELRDKDTGAPALALVRLYKTHPGHDLPTEIVGSLTGSASLDVVGGDIACLTLLATAGTEPQWNDRQLSQDHQAIPLASPRAIQALPMVSALFTQLGLNAEDLTGSASTLLRRVDDGGCGVFYVPEAAGSPHVPGQDFVAAYGIRSVVGFGGVLPDGHMFAVVMFATVPVSARTADEFATIAFSVNLALLPFADGPIFTTEDGEPSQRPLETSLRVAAAREAALIGLLDARQRVVIDQATELKRAASDAEDRAAALQRSQDVVAANEELKSAILDAAMDCLVAIDVNGRILEFNHAAEQTFGYRRDQVLGRTMAELIIPARQRRAHKEGIVRYLDTGQSRIVNERIELNAVCADGSEIPIELAVTRAGADDPPVFVGYMRDLRPRRAIEAALAAASERSAHIAQTLQTSLLPPTLPVIPGLDLAASYRAVGDGYDVGGDFYDVFELDNDDWAFGLGDVMGKGPEAAVVTALARYTIRAAAIRTHSPVEVLALLNEAILRQHPERPCTAIYGRLQRIPNGYTVNLASGGHVPAMIRRANGDVIETDAAGLILGPFPDWSGRAQDLTLHGDDLLLVYSDGITEARRDRDLYGSERLAATLAATRGMTAYDTISAITEDVTRLSFDLCDDVAILAIRAVSTATGS